MRLRSPNRALWPSSFVLIFLIIFFRLPSLTSSGLCSSLPKLVIDTSSSTAVWKPDKKVHHYQTWITDICSINSLPLSAKVFSRSFSFLEGMNSLSLLVVSIKKPSKRSLSYLVEQVLFKFLSSIKSSILFKYSSNFLSSVGLLPRKFQ